MGLSPKAFYNMSLKEWTMAQQGFFDMEEAKMRGEWERARWMAYVFLKPHDTKKNLHSVTDLVKFSWEKVEDGSDLLDDETMAYLARKMGRYVDNEGNFFNA